MIVSVECPSCATAFPVDPDKVPQGGARTECTVCETPFRVDPASWGEEGGGVEPWAADAAEARATEAVVDDSGVAMDEFAPAEEAWQPDSGDDSEEASWEGMEQSVEAVAETPIEGVGELEGLESPDAEVVAGDSADGGFEEGDAADAGVFDAQLSGVEGAGTAAVGAEVPESVMPEPDVSEPDSYESELAGTAELEPGSPEPDSYESEFAEGDASESEVPDIDLASSDLGEADLSEAEPREIETSAADSFEALETESEFSPFGFDESGDVQATVEEVEEVEEVETGITEAGSVLEESHGTGFDAPTFDGADSTELETPEHGLSESLGETGELVTDQWADLVDSDTDEDEVEISSDWSADDGSTWVVETDDGPGLEIGGIELERLDTVEEHVRAAQEDPDLTEPAEGVDLNVASTPDSSGFGDFMTGEEMVLPEDALQAGGSGLEFEEHSAEEGSGQDDFAVEDFAADVTPDGQGMAAEAPGPAPEMPESTTGIVQEEEFALPEPAPEAPEVVADVGAGEVAGDVGSTFRFGRRDPHDKARRLARVLVSDMITYNPERHAQALQNGRVKADFEEEIEKSWAEYVEQVGPEIAESTDYWRDALNEILAGDEALF